MPELNRVRPIGVQPVVVLQAVEPPASQVNRHAVAGLRDLGLIVVVAGDADDVSARGRIDRLLRQADCHVIAAR